MKWMVLFALAVPRACFSATPMHAPLDADVSADASEHRLDGEDALMPAWAPTVHPSGTLLRDRGGRFWVVDRWPDRRELLPSVFGAAPYDLTRAIPLEAGEERCLRASADLWSPRLGWRLRRLSDGTLWYIDERAGYRRRARASVIRAWRDDEAAADRLEGSLAFIETHFRDLGPLPPPNGALFSAEGTIYFFANGRLSPFVTEALFHEAGYDASQLVLVSFFELYELGEVSAPLTRAFFSICPLAAAQLRATEDHDHDGVPFFQDCDDDDARRHPHAPEICDGIDNDCDLVADNGFDVGTRCYLDNACHTPTFRRCAFDRLHTECEDDEAVCAE